MIDFKEYLDAFGDDVFEERPVPVAEFVSSPDYLNFPPLSKYQLEIVEVGSIIYFEETLIDLYGVKRGRHLFDKSKKEIILMLGKGSGKDAMSNIICCYIVYLLLCLRDPALYYGKPSGNNIDIVNVAINAKQANNVFFHGLKEMVKKCPWFRGKYKAKANEMEFDKNVRVHSLNSEGESTEGYNIIVAVLDEIDGFDEGKETEKGKKMYKTLRATVSSRFKTGKILALSFPRSTDGFIMSKYDDFVKEKVVVKREHTFKLDPSLPDGDSSNEFGIEWDEDHIVSYKYSDVWALRRPSWEVNPTIDIEDFVKDFYSDEADSLGRFACQPADFTDNAFFRDRAKIDATFTYTNGVREDGSIIIKPKHDKEYYIHVDLARLHDNCAVAMAHVDSFRKIRIGNTETDPSPMVVVDLVKYWKPSKDNPIDFSHVREFIISLRRANFNIRLVTFDRWESKPVIEQLNAVALRADTLSVDRDHYNEMALVMGENRLKGPDVPLLKSELRQLEVTKTGKVDHPRKSTKDLSDAVAGAIFNAITHTHKEGGGEVVTYHDLKKEERAKVNDSVIRGPKDHMPSDLRSFMDYLRVL